MSFKTDLAIPLQPFDQFPYQSKLAAMDNRPKRQNDSPKWIRLWSSLAYIKYKNFKRITARTTNFSKNTFRLIFGISDKSIFG